MKTHLFRSSKMFTNYGIVVERLEQPEEILEVISDLNQFDVNANVENTENCSKAGSDITKVFPTVVISPENVQAHPEIAFSPGQDFSSLDLSDKSTKSDFSPLGISVKCVSDSSDSSFRSDCETPCQNTRLTYGSSSLSPKPRTYSNVLNDVTSRSVSSSVFQIVKKADDGSRPHPAAKSKCLSAGSAPNLNSPTTKNNQTSPLVRDSAKNANFAVASSKKRRSRRRLSYIKSSAVPKDNVKPVDTSEKRESRKRLSSVNSSDVLREGAIPTTVSEIAEKSAKIWRPYLTDDSDQVKSNPVSDFPPSTDENVTVEIGDENADPETSSAENLNPRKRKLSEKAESAPKRRSQLIIASSYTARRFARLRQKL